jgi:hypothetical protein
MAQLKPHNAFLPFSEQTILMSKSRSFLRQARRNIAAFLAHTRQAGNGSTLEI